ncbi:hypothetical protein VNO78_18434 [Psophocarpus tetragonolobus]|uniref:Uncharacterized protein n=1 Tax=Psophocarpus tetragonolobus TaxID=3891 RepID=A0AAN9SJF7_PSOTE
MPIILINFNVQNNANVIIPYINPCNVDVCFQNAVSISYHSVAISKSISDRRYLLNHGDSIVNGPVVGLVTAVVVLREKVTAVAVSREKVTTNGRSGGGSGGIEERVILGKKRKRGKEKWKRKKKQMIGIAMEMKGSGGGLQRNGGTITGGEEKG